ncbi:transposase [Rhizobium sp. 32-5/1]|uniref:transposase n=1 Tax=Rhizobium sp. 32-5/1 TaxID=3019602 RepID=UPI00240CFF3D|nr:transposase [Rhizobium sp. 32-5/1]WEZ82309.1 transposase [Rhizobium sp. 32-5/1]
MLRPPAVVQGKVVARLRSRLERELRLSLLHRAPLALVDYAEFRHVLSGPFTFRIKARDAFAGVRIFQIQARLEAYNQPIHRIRGRIEKIFGTWKRSYGLRRVRWRRLAKAGAQIRLTAIAYNMQRSLKIIAMAG